MDSIWTIDCTLPSSPALTGEIQADAAVIGGGITGLLTAYLLQKQGLHTVVLEADTICSGQTGRTTAKITAGHGLCYSRIENDWDAHTASRYAQAMQKAIEDYARLIEYERIDCDFTRCAHILYSTSDPESIRRESEAALRAGLNAQLTTETELPFAVAAAVRLTDQARFHPLKFLRAIAAQLTIYEHTRVLDVSEDRLRTDPRRRHRAPYRLCQPLPVSEPSGLLFPAHAPGAQLCTRSAKCAPAGGNVLERGCRRLFGAPRGRLSAPRRRGTPHRGKPYRRFL